MIVNTIQQCSKRFSLMKKNFFLLFSLFLTLPCQAEQHFDDLKEDEGYLVLAVNIEGMIPKSLKLASKATFGSGYTMDSLAFGDNLKIIKLTAGEYTWERLKINRTYRFDLDDEAFSVNVEAGKINYSGHLLVNIYQQFETASFNYVNRSSLVFDELRNCCDALNKKYPLVFTGESQDPFIDFYSNLVKAEVK